MGWIKIYSKWINQNELIKIELIEIEFMEMRWIEIRVKIEIELNQNWDTCIFVIILLCFFSGKNIKAVCCIVTQMWMVKLRH